MSGDQVTLTARDVQTIRRALCDADDERSSFADAYRGQGPEAAQALAWVKRYRQLHRKLFGEPTHAERLAEEMRNAKSISIHQLAAGKPAQDDD